MQDVRYPIWLDPFYSGLSTTGNLIPWYRNILIRDLHSVTEGKVIIQGYHASVPTEVTLSNVVVDGISAADFVSKYRVTTPTYSQFTLGPDPVNFAQFLTGPGVTVQDNVTTSAPPYACPAAIFAPIAGELIPGPVQVVPGQSLTVQAQILTTKEIPYATYQSNLQSAPNASLALTAPTGTVTIYDRWRTVGSATLTGSGNRGTELVPILLPPMEPGIHVLTARYSGDSNYPPITFGNYVLTVGRGDATTTSVTASSTSPAAGESVTFTASVSGQGHSKPWGLVKFTAGTVNLGTTWVGGDGTASVMTKSLTPGVYPVIATFSGNAGAVASTSEPLSITVSQATTTVGLQADNARVNQDQPVTFTAQINTAFGEALKPGGTVRFVDGTTTLATVNVMNSMATYTTATLAPGTHSITAVYSGDADFVGATSGAVNVEVNGLP
jgi:hypothetical protein